MSIIEEVKFDVNGLIPAIAQDYQTKEVLMLAYMNEESLKKTLETKKTYYYSRSRGKLWLKGEESGNFQLIKEIRYDCDRDSILLLVEQIGVACHTGHKSCFYRNIEDEIVSDKKFEESQLYNHKIVEDLYQTIVTRKNEPIDGSYTNYLFDKGIDKILKKVGEETAEVIIAAKNNDKNELIYEASDLMYHLSVLMVNNGVNWNDIYSELIKRHN